MTPDHAREALEQALGLHRAGRPAEAEQLCRRVLEARPDEFSAWTLLGSVHLARGAPRDALPCFDRALALEPRQPAAWMNRGNALRAVGGLDEALRSYDRCVTLTPQDPQAWSNRSVILGDMRRHEEALRSCERALALAPNHAQALNNRGLALAALGRIDEALESYERSIRAAPADPAVHLNRATALFSLLRLEEALAGCNQALGLRPGFAPALGTRGAILKDMGRYEEALADYEQAARLAPGIPYNAGALLFLKMQLCDWQGIDALYREVEAGLLADRPVCHPFALLPTPADAALQRRCAEAFVRERYALTAGARAPVARTAPGGRIRLGYFSADLHEHATAYLMAELFELHDRTRFEVTAFSYGIPSTSPMRRRLEAAIEHFVDVSGLGDAAIAALSRERGIDIAVDLKGFTQDGRPGIFMHRAAAVQVSYLGYPGTLGAPFMDYVIADGIVLPPGLEAHFSERVVRLPGTYQVNDRKRHAAHRPTRAQAGLPDEGVVFCCFNNTFKITPDVFAAWCRVVARVPGSVLWLLGAAPPAMERLRRAAGAAGIAPHRLVFAPKLPLAEHLARLGIADLCLDTFYYGAHTTASDALWVGVPVVTRLGGTFASRVAASLLHAAGLPELVARSTEEYEAIAIALAASPARLQEARARLVEGRDRCALFDTPAFARRLEEAYLRMLAPAE